MRLTRQLRRPLPLVLCTLTALALSAGTASADAGWDKNKGDCEETAFADPDNVEVKKLVTCIYRWETHRKDIKGATGAFRARVISAAKRLYILGDDEDAAVSSRALERLGVTTLPVRGKAAAAAATKPKEPKRKAFSAPEPDKKEKASADKYFKKGYGLAAKKKYDDALGQYLKMVDAAPGYAKGHYNVACMYALLEDEGKMVEYLRNLNDLAGAGNTDAAPMVRLTWTDTDFDGIRNGSVRYKDVTGYALIRIVNEIPDLDEDNPFNLELSLKKLGYKPEIMDADKQSYKHPVIYYAPHARSAAYVVKTLIKHPKTQVEMHAADDLGGFDVIVRWSDDIKKEQNKSYVKDPADAEKELDSLARKQDELLRQPEDAVDEMNDVLGKPAETQENIEENLERPGKAIDRAEKTLDKLKNPFK